MGVWMGNIIMNANHNILIVDDDCDFRENLSGILRDAGCKKP